jgi:hypothetical protein
MCRDQSPTLLHTSKQNKNKNRTHTTQVVNISGYYVVNTRCRNILLTPSLLQFDGFLLCVRIHTMRSSKKADTQRDKGSGRDYKRSRFNSIHSAKIED